MISLESRIKQRWTEYFNRDGDYGVSFNSFRAGYLAGQQDSEESQSLEENKK